MLAVTPREGTAMSIGQGFERRQIDEAAAPCCSRRPAFRKIAIIGHQFVNAD
jgi:hypothetical protein